MEETIENQAQSTKLENSRSFKVPELRFPEFGGEWKEIELYKIAEINPKSSKLPPSFIYIDLESVYQGVLEKEERISLNEAPSRAQRLLQKFDILFQMVRPYQQNNYFFDKDANDFVASTGYAQIRNHRYCEYLFQYLHTERFVNKVLVRCTGTSYPAINSNDLGKILIKLPLLPEQQKIASFLTAIDTKIQQLTKKKELLEQYKKGVMQQIFSREIRFKDNDGNDYPEWEEKRLGEVSDVRDGTHESPKYKNEGFPLITSKNLMSDGSIDFNNVNFISGEDYESINRRSGVKIGDILFGMIGTIGNPVVIRNKGFAIKNVALIKEQNNLSNDFLLHYLKSRLIAKQFYKKNAGGTQKFIALGIIRQLEILVPQKPEQQKITNFLTGIDKKINLINKQLEHVKLFKKGLLQQMFV